MNARRLMSLTVAGAGLALVAGTVPAYADSTPSPSPSAPTGTARTCSADRLSYVQARVDTAVKKRLVTIDRLTRRSPRAPTCPTRTAPRCRRRTPRTPAG